jgi:hypothetical protein
MKRTINADRKEGKAGKNFHLDFQGRALQEDRDLGKKQKVLAFCGFKNIVERPADTVHA